MYVIAGLGNPDKKYQNTRHNIGFDVIDALAEKYNISMNEKKHKAICGKGMIAGEKVLLVKPQTYMNLSGESIAEVMAFYKLDPAEDLIVIFDDISLSPGNIRIRAKGSAGGHNVIKSIIAETGSSDFARIKVGVGEKPEGWDLADHVLGHFSKEERARYIGLWEKEEKGQRLAMLEEKRHALLEEIHKKEEQLNHLDYLRHETRQENRR